MAGAKFTGVGRSAAVIGAVTSIAAVVAGILMLTTSSFFGPLSDAFSALTLVLMLPVVVVVHGLVRSQAPTLSLVAAFIGVLSALTYGVLEALVAAGALDYDQVSTVNVVASAGVGVWLLLANFAALRGAVYGRGLAWAGLASGAGFVVLVLGFTIYPIFAIWLWRWLLAHGEGVVVVSPAPAARD